MSTAKFCIRHRVTTLMAVIMISIFGIVFAGDLQLALLPDLEAPMAVVYCYYNGASPSDMEELITRPLESAVMSVPGVESVDSTSSDGTSTLQITYVDGTDLDIAATKLRERFDMLTLPDGAVDPVIVNINISEIMPTAIIALGGTDLTEVQTLADDTVGPALERIDGVAQVSISGGIERQVAVEVNPTRAAGYGLSNSYISQMLVAQNLLYPAGDLQNGVQKYTVTTDATFQTVDDIANMILPLPSGGNIRLNEVANVVLETTDQDTIAEVDGGSCVILQVSRQSGSNEVATSEAVAEAMETLQARNPNMNYAIPYLASDYINQSVDSALQNIYLGVALAAIVVFIFLHRLGATAAIAVSMPVCVLTVFVLMHVCDLTMNMMSLGGIAMGVGMIVDNSIVVLENIYRFAAEGHNRMEACVEGTKEVMLSLTASTLTTVAVFLPLGLADGLAGMIFKDFCLTIAFLILASLVISVTLVPLLCYLLLSDKGIERHRARQNRKKQRRHYLMDAYTAVLGFFTDHLLIGLGISVALVAYFLYCCLNTNAVLLPAMDQGTVRISISTPTGTELEQTADICEQAVAVAQANVPELVSLYYTSQAESGTVSLTLSPRSERTRTSQQVAADLRTPLQDIPGAEITVSAMDMSSMMTGSDISLDITGMDYETLVMIADDLMEQISALPDAIDVTSSVAAQIDQVQVTMDREAAAQYGLTAATVGEAVRSELTGSTATTVTLDNKEIDVVVRGDGAASNSLDALRSMSISTPVGGSVPLGAVASVDVVKAPQTISRSNQSRSVSITGNTISGNTTAITEQINEILDHYTLPQGYNAEISGAYADIMESFGDLILALIVALGLVYFVLASQFESFLMPVIVMLILPVAFSGALFALPVTGRDLSMISLVAIIMLAGTVVNASIILVDYIKTRREMGELRRDAILHACPLRVRPVLMTTLTTILAMVPMALGWGETNEMLEDMGVTMISGMGISTIITLFFTPVYYSLIDTISHPIQRRRERELEKEQKKQRREARQGRRLAAPVGASEEDSDDSES